MKIQEVIASHEANIKRDRAEIERILNRAQAAGLKDLSEVDSRRIDMLFANIDTAKEAIAQANAIVAEEAGYSARSAERFDPMTGKRIESGRTAGHEFRAHVTSEEHVYSRGNDPNGQKFLLDVARGTLFGEASAQARLQRHQHEARVDMHGSGQMEYRTDSYADSSDFPGLVVPQYLTSLFQPMAANARPLADAMRHETLSSEGLHVELATGATGVSVVVNPGELVTPTPVGNFDVAPLELDVNTIQTYATVTPAGYRKRQDRKRAASEYAFRYGCEA